eukprot:16431814-Heterocapsa_arctica.AAC.1
MAVAADIVERRLLHAVVRGARREEQQAAAAHLPPALAEAALGDRRLTKREHVHRGLLVHSLVDHDHARVLVHVERDSGLQAPL